MTAEQCHPQVSKARSGPANDGSRRSVEDAVTNTALLALDLQRDFLEANGRMSVGTKNAELVIASANRLLEHAERAGWKLISIKSEFPRTDWIGNLFRRDAAIERSVGAEMDPRVRFPPSSLELTKSKPDAFTNPALAEILKAAGIQHIVIFGVMAEGCVRATVKSARRQGFDVTVVFDGVVSSREFLRRFAFESMRRAGSRLANSAEILKGF
jgi:nicotinamidase-related amidase